jgi:hypothetical protein
VVQTIHREAFVLYYLLLLAVISHQHQRPTL